MATASPSEAPLAWRLTALHDLALRSFSSRRNAIEAYVHAAHNLMQARAAAFVCPDGVLATVVPADAEAQVREAVEQDGATLAVDLGVAGMSDRLLVVRQAEAGEVNDEDLLVVRRLAEGLRAALHHTRREADLMWELSRDLLIVAGGDGTLRRLSPSWEATLGYAPDDLIDENVLEHMHPDDHATGAMYLQQLGAGLPVQHFRCRHRHADGSWRWIEWNAHPLAEDDAVYAVGRDVTRVIERERKMRHNEALLDGLLGSSLDGIVALRSIRDDEGTIVDFEWRLANPRAAEAAGLRAHQLVGKRLLETDAGLQHFFDDFKNVVETGEVFERTVARGGPGTQEHVALTAVQLDDGLAITLRDVTAATKQREALRRTRERFAKTFHASPVASLLCRMDDGVCLDANAQFTRLMGYARMDIVGRPVSVLSTEHAEERRDILHELLQHGRVERVLQHLQTADGERRAVLLSLEALDLDATRAVLVMGVDITERVRAEEEVARANEQLTQRNRELQDFAYVASHDLQEPLRKIQAFGDLLEQDYGHLFDEQGTYFLSRVRDAASRMSQLIADLLAFSRVQTRGGAFVQCDLDEVLEHVVDVLELRLQETDGRVEVEDALCTLEADPSQMRQLLQNLLGNALKFHREDVPPVVRVSARVEEPGDEALGHRPSICVITIADNGIGFDPKFAEKVFTPFQRLHGRGAYEGTGMGLAICRRIVERHGGSMEVKSAPNEGACFTVRLPLSQPRHDAAEEEGSRAANAPLFA